MIHLVGVHNQDTLAEQVDAIYRRQSDVYLVGSLGRAMTYDSLIGTPFVEFDESGLTRRPDGTTRDIDVANLNVINWLQAGPIAEGPFTMDNFCSPIASIERKAGGWVLRSQARHFEAELDERVMQPVEHNLLGARAITVPPQTHLALLGIKGILREKDARNQQLLAAALQEGNGLTLDEDLFEPFEELKESWKKDLVLKARDAYRRVMPKAVHRQLAPVHRATLKLLKHY